MESQIMIQEDLHWFLFFIFSEHTSSGMLLHKWSKRIKVCLDTAYFVEIEKLLLKVL